MNGLYISFGSKFVYWGKGKFIAYSGRIWIRSILKKEKEKEAKVITGSHKCADELLGGFFILERYLNSPAVAPEEELLTEVWLPIVTRSFYIVRSVIVIST